MRYSAQNVKKSGSRISADLMEDDVIVGTITRKPSHPFVVRFNTERCETEFLSFCDSLSAGEVAEILVNTALDSNRAAA